MDSHKVVVREWLAKAENDFLNLSDMMERLQPHQVDLACFCAQQCTEKLLKAALLFCRETFGKSHDLRDLAERLQGKLPEWSPDLKALERLALTGIAARYPGVVLSFEDVRQSFALCCQVRSSILPMLQNFLDG